MAPLFNFSHLTRCFESDNCVLVEGLLVRLVALHSIDGHFLVKERASCMSLVGGLMARR